MQQYTIYSTPSAARSTARPHLDALDGLRFAAAMHIVVFHTLHLPGLRLVNWGSTSTSLFFILSGFVLAYAYTSAEGGLRVPVRDFWWRRFARLYPLAVLTQLAVIPSVWSSYAPGERLPRAAAVLAGVQGWFPSIADSFNSPGWSVSVLVFCYLALPAVAAALRGWGTRRLAVALAAVWVWCLVPAGAYVLADGGPRWLTAINHHPLSRFPEFLFGVVLARLMVASPRLRVPRWTAAAGVALLAAALLWLPAAVFPLAHNGLLAPLHGVVIAGLAAGGGVIARLLATRPMRKLGNASFAMFLVHVPLYAWTMMPLAPTLTRLPLAARIAAYAGYLALTAATGWAVQRWIADPIARGLRRDATSRRTADVPVLAPEPAALPL